MVWSHWKSMTYSTKSISMILESIESSKWVTPNFSNDEKSGLVDDDKIDDWQSIWVTENDSNDKKSGLVDDDEIDDDQSPFGSLQIAQMTRRAAWSMMMMAEWGAHVGDLSVPVSPPFALVEPKRGEQRAGIWRVRINYTVSSFCAYQECPNRSLWSKMH